jgi:hypothetical protein
VSDISDLGSDMFDLDNCHGSGTRWGPDISDLSWLPWFWNPMQLSDQVDTIENKVIRKRFEHSNIF